MLLGDSSYNFVQSILELKVKGWMGETKPVVKQLKKSRDTAFGCFWPFLY